MSSNTSGEACPLPSRGGGSDSGAIERMLRAGRVAIVGLSDDPSRPSYQIASYLIAHGFDVVGINPNHQTVLGRPCYASLQDVPGSVDLVNVFRRPLACGEVARGTVAIGAKGLWLQSGIRNDEAKDVAREAGIDFVQDRCIMIEHMSHR